ncbi:MAG: type II toxin-antitoxin system RelE/ParE family toxin [Chthoniobacterales bacterium]
MGYALRLTSRAVKNLAEIVDYICRNDPDAAFRFEEALLKKADLLTLHPEVGVVVKRRVGVRYIPYRSYLIFYRIDDISKKIEILRFWHWC